MPRRNHQHTRAQGAKRKPKGDVFALEVVKKPSKKTGFKVGQTIEQWRREQGF